MLKSQPNGVELPVTNDPNHNLEVFARHLFALARRKPWLWAAPLVCFATAGALYAFLMPKTWQAQQSFVVRDEWIGQDYRPGRFDSLDDMKTAQETITEVAGSPKVLQGAYAAMGQSASPKDIEELREAISFRPANGAEFGRTEVLSLVVKSKSPDRALKLVDVLFVELANELRVLRRNRAASMVSELSAATQSSRADLDQVAQQLQALEQKVGVNLADLRFLNEPNSATGTLNRQLDQVRSELRPAAHELTLLRQQQQNLKSVLDNPNELLGTPSELLQLQPGLARLKEGLVAAQLNFSQVSGKYGDLHPKVQAAAAAVEATRQQMFSELKTVQHGLDTQIKIAQAKTDRLNRREQELSELIANLASVRVEYGRLSEEFKQRTQMYQEALAQLEKAESIHTASETVNLIQRVDEPYAETRPLGPGKSTIILGTTLAGFAFGLGIVVLLTPLPPHGQPDVTRHASKSTSTSARPPYHDSASQQSVVPGPQKQQAQDLDSQRPEYKPAAARPAQLVKNARAIAQQLKDLQVATPSENIPASGPSPPEASRDPTQEPKVAEVTTRETDSTSQLKTHSIQPETDASTQTAMKATAAVIQDWKQATTADPNNNPPPHAATPAAAKSPSKQNPPTNQKETARTLPKAVIDGRKLAEHPPIFVSPELPPNSN